MTRTLLCIVALLVGASTWAGDIDRYRYFMEEGILDVGVSNQVANDIVAQGIASNDPEIVDTTIRSLRKFAMFLAHDFLSPPGQLPERSFAEVSGLKEFLIAHWRRNHKESGYNTHQMSSRELENFHATVEAKEGGRDSMSSEEYWQALLEAWSPWPATPQILCVFWPRDDDVHRIVWENHEKDLSPNLASQTLGLLNVGKFTTPRADAFREEVLRSSLTSQVETAHVNATFAAKGLALSRPPEALPLLISVAKAFGASRGELMIVIAAYDDEQLAAHTEELRPLVEGYESWRPMGADAEARERLKEVLGFGGETSTRREGAGTYEYTVKFKYFMEEGVYLQEVSNRAANDMVAEGIASGDPLIEELTLWALGGLAQYIAGDQPSRFGKLPSRTFSEISGLKKFLIAEWRGWHGKTGRNADEANRRAMDRWGQLPWDADGQQLPIDIEEYREALTSGSSSWVLIPKILCVFWPGDQEVLELLWEMRDKDLSPDTPRKVLDLLILGAFATPEADEYRIETLRLALSEVHESDTSKVAPAAVGLALSRATHALPLLIRCGEMYPLARPHILVALAEFPDEDLTARAGELTRLLELTKFAARPMGAEVEAYERLQGLVSMEVPR